MRKARKLRNKVFKARGRYTLFSHDFFFIFVFALPRGVKKYT